jgi:predicted dinucleotide-binding enzyme
MLDDRRLVVPYRGDDPAAEQMARQLVIDIGGEPLTIGDPDAGTWLDP